MNATSNPSLNADHLIQAAEYATASWGMCDDGLRRRLQALVERVNQSGKLDVSRIAGAHAQLLAMLQRRLRLQADLKRVPAILQERISRPVFIIGYSRTGTTLLHSLLAQDDQNRAPRVWQTRVPSPPPGEVPVAPYRLAQASRDLDAFVDATPGILTMHPYWDEGALALVEDEEIFSLDLQSPYPTLLYAVPGLDGSTAANDAAGAYRFQRRFLQHQQWNLPDRRWVLKGVMHQFQLDALFAEYPDALCLWPHRDPVNVFASTLSIMSVVYGAAADGGRDWRQFAREFIDGTQGAMDAVLANPLLDDPRIRHLRFAELTADPVRTICDAYGAWNIPIPAGFVDAMRHWLTCNEGHRYGRYVHSLEPFGLDATQIRARFSDYCERFGV